jgi:hypothetical protein
MAEREEVVRGLRALADFLEAHPDLPAPWHIPASASISGSDDAERAEVDRIAAILGVPATANERGTHYGAERDFGGGVKYEATAITQAHMDAYSEHMKDWPAGEEG